MGEEEREADIEREKVKEWGRGSNWVKHDRTQYRVEQSILTSIDSWMNDKSRDCNRCYSLKHWSLNYALRVREMRERRGRVRKGERER